MDLTKEDRARLLKIDRDTGLRVFDLEKCLHCSGVHTVMPCPRIKRRAFTWHDGKQVLTEEEFWQWDEWPHDQVIFDSDLYDPDDEVVSGEA